MVHLPQTEILGKTIKVISINLMGYFIVLNYKKSLLSFQSQPF